MSHTEQARAKGRPADLARAAEARRTSGAPRRDDTVAGAVERAKEGDPDAIRYLFVRFSADVYAHARNIVRDEHEAEDLTQQVFAKLITVISKYEQRDVPFSAWIMRVTHNIAVDHLRRMRMVPCAEVYAADAISDEDQNKQRVRSLTDALAELPTEQRRVLLLRHVVGMTPTEIAAKLGKSEGSIHGLHHRGRGALKAALVALDAAPNAAA